MCLNPVNEEFDQAYANVGLLASETWSFKKEVTRSDYKKANLQLWIRFNEIEQRLVDDESDDGQSITSDGSEQIVHSVKDTIPFSRLASYNDFSYNEERERMYVNEVDPSQYVPSAFPTDQKDLEIWMLPEVEEEFKRLTRVSSSKWCTMSPRLRTGRELVPAEQVIKTSPHQWLIQTPWPDQLLSRYPDLPLTLQHSIRLSLFTESTMPSNYNDTDLEEKLDEFPCPRYLVETGQDLKLHSRIDSVAIRRLWAPKQFDYGDSSPCYSLNAEVPEFQPVSLRQEHYPSIYDLSYEAELFPYSTFERNRLQPNSVPNNVCFEENQLIKNIPVFIHPPENLKPSRKKHQGVVLSNLVPLTGSEQYNVVGAPEQSFEPCKSLVSTPSYDPSTFKPLTTQQMLAFLDKWLDNIYNPRSNDFIAISSTSSKIDKIFLNVQQNFCLSKNEVNPNDSKYEELEREALEQYSDSNSRLDSTVLDQDIQEGLIEEDKTTSYQGEKNYWENKLQQKAEESDDFFSPASSPSPCSSKLQQVVIPSQVSKKVREENHSSCSPQKQAMWMKQKKKKKKKNPDKKRQTKHKNKPLNDNQGKCIEVEIALINKFLAMNKMFLQLFFEGDWKIVETLITTVVAKSFEDCFSMVDYCLEQFKILIMSNELKEDYKVNKKRLELADKVVVTLQEMLRLLYGYFRSFSKIKTTIPSSNNFLTDPEKLNVQLALVTCGHLIETQSNGGKCLLNVNPITIFKGKYFPKLLDCTIENQIMTYSNKREWKLKLNHDTQVNRMSLRIRMDKKGHFHLAPNKKKELAANPNRKLLRVVDNFPIWSASQWLFADGWVFSEGDTQFPFDWFNKFKASSLESMTTSAHICTVYDWVFDFIDAAFFTCKFNPTKYEMIWNINRCNLVGYNIFFVKLLLKQKEKWYFGNVQIRKQSCLPQMAGCEGTCCINWTLRYSSSRKSSSKECTSTTKSQLQNVPTQKLTGQIKKESKENESHSKGKSKDRLPPEKQLILDKIARGEINLPQEKSQLGYHQSSCSLQ